LTTGIAFSDVDSRNGGELRAAACGYGNVDGAGVTRVHREATAIVTECDFVKSFLVNALIGLDRDTDFG
jgi:hypothetical protein